MTPCPTCGSHLRRGSSCPHCGSLPSVPPIGRTTVAAVLLGLAVAGCSGDKDTDATGDTADTGETTSPTTGVDYGSPMSY